MAGAVARSHFVRRRSVLRQVGPATKGDDWSHQEQTHVRCLDDDAGWGAYLSNFIANGEWRKPI